MMDKHAIIARLNEITSFFSFGRILGKISLNEIVGIERQLKHGQEANRKRLISTEIDFLCGLWLQNINLSKHWDFIQDQKIMDEVYDLMDDFHISYKNYCMKAVWNPISKHISMLLSVLLSTHIELMISLLQCVI